MASPLPSNTIDHHPQRCEQSHERLAFNRLVSKMSPNSEERVGQLFPTE